MFCNWNNWRSSNSDRSCQVLTGAVNLIACPLHLLESVGLAFLSLSLWSLLLRVGTSTHLLTALQVYSLLHLCYLPLCSMYSNQYLGSWNPLLSVHGCYLTSLLLALDFAAFHCSNYHFGGFCIYKPQEVYTFFPVESWSILIHLAFSCRIVLSVYIQVPLVLSLMLNSVMCRSFPTMSSSVPMVWHLAFLGLTSVMSIMCGLSCAWFILFLSSTILFVSVSAVVYQQINMFLTLDKSLLVFYRMSYINNNLCFSHNFVNVQCIMYILSWCA